MAVFALGLAACLDEDPRDPTRTRISSAIMQPRCGTASCHSSLAQTSGLILDTRDAGYRTLGHGSYVIAGDVGGSALVYLLRGQEVSRMPPDSPLPRIDVELVERWIADGARE